MVLFNNKNYIKILYCTDNFIPEAMMVRMFLLVMSWGTGIIQSSTHRLDSEGDSKVKTNANSYLAYMRKLTILMIP